MPQVYYKQSVNRRTNGWSMPMTTRSPLWNMWSNLKDVHWRKIKKSAFNTILAGRIPFAINKIERWHKRNGHSIVRRDVVYGQYRTTYMMVTHHKKSK